MKVLIGEAISFDNENHTATIYGKYEIKHMTNAEFATWADDTTADWFTEDYTGTILNPEGVAIYNPLYDQGDKK